MKMKLLARFLAVSSLAMLESPFLPAQSHDEIKQLAVHISTNAASFVAGSEIDVNVDLTNQSANDIEISRGLTQPEMAGFEFIVTRAGPIPNSPVQMTPYLWALNGRRAPRESVKDPDLEVNIFGSFGGGISLKSGSTAHFSALMNKLYDLSTPGSYTIQARKWPYGLSSGLSFPDTQPNTTSIESNAITISVTDPPPPAIDLELSTGATSFTSGSEIDMAVTIRNISATSLSIPFDASQPAAELNLQPNQTIQHPVTITKLNDLTSTGSYLVQAVMGDPVTHLTVKSNVVTIVVE